METLDLNKLLDGLPIAVFVMDDKGRPIYANHRAIELLGRGVDPEAAPEQLAEVYHAYVAGTTKPYPTESMPIVRALGGEEGWVDDMEIRLPGRPPVSLEVWAKPIPDANGNVRFAAAAFADISERRKLERLLRLLQIVTADANQASSIEAVFERAVEEICSLLGWAVGHVFLRDPGSEFMVSIGVWHVDDTERFRGFIEETERTRFRSGPGLIGRVLDTARPQWIADLSSDPMFVRTSAARLGLCGALAIPVLSGEAVVGILEFFTTAADEPDPLVLEIIAQAGMQLGRVVERLRGQESLRLAYLAQQEESERLRSLDEIKNMFLQAVSHDLHNPVAAIKGFLELLQTRGESLAPARVEEIYRMIEASADRLQRLLGDLLDLDRLRRGVIAAQRQTIDLCAYVRDLLAQLPLREHPVDVEPQSFAAAVDPAQFERIVENLLINAVKHTLTDTPIHVRIEPSGDGVLLVVEDEGPGVPDEKKEAIFNVFERGPTTAGGSGVGLSLVQRFAELHGGRAWVEDRPGGGASFRVSLPSGP